MDAIHEFLSERKEAWLKKSLDPSASEDAQAATRQEAATRFALSTWLPDAAKRAGWLPIASHPGKFSHPDAKSSAIIAHAAQKNDGYLRTGNVEYPLDAFGNAAAMDVNKFLNLSMSDGRSVLTHLEQDSEAMQRLMTVSSASYQELKTGFLAIKQNNIDSLRTDERVKQVYFPISENSYHLLSLLTPSGLVYKLRTIIDDMRFSETTKNAKEARKNKIDHATGFDDISNLTVIGYGGTKPQTISVLNSQNAGRAYLLMSVPPVLEPREIQLPKSDFFANGLRTKSILALFKELHHLMQDDVRNNRHTRRRVHKLIIDVVSLIVGRVRSMRSHSIGWSSQDYYRALPKIQKIWLDEEYATIREENQDYLDDISDLLARWFILAYESYTRKTNGKAIILGDDELLNLKYLVKEALTKNKEILK